MRVDVAARHGPHHDGVARGRGDVLGEPAARLVLELEGRGDVQRALAAHGDVDAVLAVVRDRPHVDPPERRLVEPADAADVEHERGRQAEEPGPAPVVDEHAQAALRSRLRWWRCTVARRFAVVLPSTTCDAKTPGANAVVDRTSSVGSTSSPALSTCPCERSVTVSLRASTTCVPVAVKNDRSVPSASRSGRSTSSDPRPTAASSPASSSLVAREERASRSAEAVGVKGAVGRSAAAAATAAAAQPDTSSRCVASGPGASASTTVTACTTAVPPERSSGRETSVGIAYSYWSTPGCTDRGGRAAARRGASAR